MKLAADHPVQCACGRFRGTLSAGSSFTRAVCYCRDCQAFAEALGDPARVLDARGGTDVVATLQRNFRVTAGIDRLACLSLTPRGLLRWHANCCGTAIANTPRNPGISYVGFVHTSLGLDKAALDAAFGPPALQTNVDSARGPVPRENRLRTLGTTLRIIARVLRARLTGAWRGSPFFGSDLKPIVSPRVLHPGPH